MNYNPQIMTTEQLQTATQIQIAQAQYEYIVAATSLAFALVMLFIAFKFAVWFLPRYWNRPKEDSK